MPSLLSFSKRRSERKKKPRKCVWGFLKQKGFLFLNFKLYKFERYIEDQATNDCEFCRFLRQFLAQYGPHFWKLFSYF